MLSLLILPSPVASQQPQLGAGYASLLNLRGQPGKRLTYVCPPGQAPARVYGTDVYTDDSSICSAAVHAGVTTFERGGPVTLVLGGSQARYAGSTRNGVTSDEFGEWPGSFRFDQRGRPSRIGWGTTAKGAEGYTGTVALICPSGGRLKEIWGSGPYTGDSSICSAAVHAGILTLANGGPITLRLGEGKQTFKESTQNGVASRSYGDYPSSFQVAPGEDKTLGTAPVRAGTMLPDSLQQRAPTDRGAATTGATPVTRARPSTGIEPVARPQGTTTATAPTASREGVAPRGDSRSTAIAPPGPAPTIVSATGFKGVAGPKYSQLSWNSAPGAVGYGLTRYDPTTQQRITLRKAGGDTVFAGTGYTDTVVTPNRTYGYRLRTFFKDQDGELVSDPDTSQGVSVTPKDPYTPLALPPNFRDSLKIQYTLSPPDPNRPYPKAADSVITLSWEWRTGAAGFRISVNEYSMYGSYLVGTDGSTLYDGIIAGNPLVGPYASTQLRWPRILRDGSTILFCIYAVSPKDPGTGKRVESRPGRLKLKNSNFSTGGKWVVEKVDSYPIGFDKCPDAPATF